ncbi:NACHT, LRR and PYD domains-containing protein 4 [Pipistrellus kuhlii]|uniref:NACHT, LRR and PYD domains-containing protein 4 n=1 Tax=Pipistrellus kuhlii TaxID=59472 RepID=UPI00174F6193|nr:NACHT, LRR and PYD domains-containing protein 4 [Pipistrellus kuhlii]
MASSFFSEFGLLWYLKELSQKEFSSFKEKLKQEPLRLGLQQIPWARVKKATREGLAALLILHYTEARAWDVAFTIFPKIDREDLCQKARKERGGHAKAYRAHVQEKFSHAWSRDTVPRGHGHVDRALTQREHRCLEHLFAPGRRTVILTGAPGVGKTTVLAKLMVAWAEGTLYQRRFSYVFYLCCREEARRAAATSLAALVCGGWSDSLAPAADIASEPERLLFILDGLGFEELAHDLDRPESDLCSDWMEPRPVRLVLSSLLRRKLLPEASLLVATAPASARLLEPRLGCLEIQTLPGLTEDEMLLSFSRMFGRRRWMGVLTFHLVRANRQLLSMCQIPALCWATGACLKQEMERGRDPALACRRATSLYSSFVLNLFMPKGAPCPYERSRAQLEGLCALAAEGMWSGTSVFGEEDLRRHGLAGPDIPTLLDAKALLRGPGGSSYSFLHLCIQEVCTALFYFVKAHGDHPSPSVGRVGAMLAAHMSGTKAQWLFLPCFLFGLLNEKEQQKLGAFFGSRLRPGEVRRAVERHLRGVREGLRGWLDALVLYYCLFEMEDEAFVRWAVDLFPEAFFLVTHPTDLVVLAYCLARGSALRKLGFSIQGVFVATSGTDDQLLYWDSICSVLTAKESLEEFRVSDCHLSGPALVTLINHLRHPRCRLPVLMMNNVSFSAESWCFFEVFSHSPGLKHLDLNGTSISHDDCKLLCDALNHPACNIEKLLLAGCGLSPEDCEGFKEVLTRSTTLKILDLSYNCLGHGLSLLCEALRLPACALRGLGLVGCQLKEPCWEHLRDAILGNRNLAHLDLSINDLKDEDLNLLCEALKQPSCSLTSLGLSNCSITANGCRDLASILSGNPNLRILQIRCNNIEDDGARLLCEALLHSNCHLERLGLGACQLTSACCEDLASVLTSSRSLKELHLAGNPLDRRGVQLLCAALRHPGCGLQTLGLNKAEFDAETQELLAAEEERNPCLTITHQ